MKTAISSAFVLLGTLVATATVASAQPAPHQPPPPPPPCLVSGPPIFEIDHLESGSKVAQVAKLFASGAWTSDETDASGKAGRHGNGCLEGGALKQARADLAAAKWQISHPKIHCMAMSANYTVYKVNDKAVFESHVCGNDILDDVSATSVADLEKLLAAAWQPPGGGPVAYACKSSSTVMFEIDHQTSAPKLHSTSTTKLFDNGAWVTTTGTAESTGCLDKDAFGKLRDELAAAPWTTTQRGVNCRAMSAGFTVYSYNGKAVYTSRTCGDPVDAKSSQAISDLEKALTP